MPEVDLLSRSRLIFSTSQHVPLLDTACTTLSEEDRAMLPQANRPAALATQKAEPAQIMPSQAVHTAKAAEDSAKQTSIAALRASADAEEARLKAKVVPENGSYE